MWKITVESGGRQMRVWRMLIAFWITKATNAHWEYVIPIVL